MKKLILLIVALSITVMVTAQTQQGYVKTKGRLDDKGNLIPGHGLKGATVSIKGKNTVIVKSEDGSFSFPIAESQFQVDSVKKKDYQLVDYNVLRTYKYSKDTLYFSMETPHRQMDDQMENFERINASQQALISQLRLEVKQLKKQNKISEEDYSRRLSEIADMQTESQKLVQEMAERYSKIDFDHLDEFNRKVSWFILNGELLKADSLIKTKGSMEERSAELDNFHKANSEVRIDLEKSEQLEAKMLEDFAEDCYNLFEICKLRHDNDSAAYWLELRVSKDTTNCHWLEQAGSFLFEYLGQYDKAYSYFNRALEHYIQQYGEQAEEIGSLYNNIGSVYADQAIFDKALDYYNEALNANKTIFGESHLEVATNYNNIGSVYHILGKYNKALEYFNKALDIESSFYKNSPNLATTYNNIGTTYKRIGKYEKAMEYYEMSLTILKSTFGENHPDVATCYSNIGSLLYNQGDFAQALEYCDEALTIRKTILGENHPDIASSYNTIGEIYDELGDKSMSWECLDKALIIRESIFGDNHPEVAQSYNNIGLWYYYKNPHDYDKALDYLNKALAIYNSVFKENHPKSISTQYSITSVEYQQVIANNTIATFCEDHCFTATIVEGETPASQQGMSGEYILLEYADWNQDSNTSMFDKNDELRGKPKDILVMKDDVIAEHHFENLIGAQLGIKYVGKEEKQRINKVYQEWKKQNRK